MSAAPVQIWIRERGTRRQAFYGSGSAWHPLQVAKAEKALRDGTLTLSGGKAVSVVPRETTDGYVHPAAAAFAAQARFLSGQIDVINQRGCASLSLLQIAALVAIIVLVLTVSPYLLDGPDAAQAEQDVQDEVAALTSTGPAITPIRPQHPSAGVPTRVPHASVVASAR